MKKQTRNHSQKQVKLVTVRSAVSELKSCLDNDSRKGQTREEELENKLKMEHIILRCSCCGTKNDYVREYNNGLKIGIKQGRLEAFKEILKFIDVKELSPDRDETIEWIKQKIDKLRLERK